MALYCTIPPVDLPLLDTTLRGARAIPRETVVAVVRQAPHAVMADMSGTQIGIPQGAANVYNGIRYYADLEYRDVEGKPGQTYRNLGPAKPGHPLAEYLREFWRTQGYAVEVHLAVKCAPTLVIGRVRRIQPGDQLQTPEETFDLSNGDWILASPSIDTIAIRLVKDTDMPLQFDRLISAYGVLLRQFANPA